MQPSLHVIELNHVEAAPIREVVMQGIKETLALAKAVELKFQVAIP